MLNIVSYTFTVPAKFKLLFQGGLNPKHNGALPLPRRTARWHKPAEQCSVFRLSTGLDGNIKVSSLSVVCCRRRRGEVPQLRVEDGRVEQQPQGSVVSALRRRQRHR